MEPLGNPTSPDSDQTISPFPRLYARISRVEEQVAAEQRLRCETEQRLTQHLNSLVGHLLNNEFAAVFLLRCYPD